ncbi:hypothetical protein BH18ACI4_BH18ACI4_05080 [soil metagenome]
MTDWAFILVPLLVLPIVLLFRFIGCGYSGKATGTGPEKPPTPPGYAETIRAEPSVIAYWRLVDGTATKAIDEKRFKDGEYVVSPGLPREEPGKFDPGSEGSEAATGGFLFPSQPGLIVSNPTAKCRFFNGGHVLVSQQLTDPVLYTDEFTIEAWVEKGWQQKIPGYKYVLFSAGGVFTATFGDNPGSHGFEAFAKVDANGDSRWDVKFFTDNAVSRNPPGILPLVPEGISHFALIVKNIGPKKFWAIYVQGKITVSGTVDFYSRPMGAPLFIGVGSRAADPTTNPEPRFPILSRIQDVVLHNKALSQEEIQNHVKLNT